MRGSHRRTSHEAHSGGDWLSGLIGGGPDIAVAYPSDYGAGGQAGGSAEASFAQWYDLLGAGNGAGDGVMVVRAGGEMVPGLAVNLLTQNNRAG